MKLLYLIRHATPVIQPERPAREWTLSERGAQEAGVLAGTASSWGLEALYSSSEPKARGTALIIGDAMGLPVHVVDGFDELRIPEWIGNSDEFNELVRTVLERTTPAGPPQLEPLIDARSPERAVAAAARFAEGVRIVAAGAMPAAIVSHGRVLTSYLSEYCEVESPFDFWRAIPMPGWTSIDLDNPRRPVEPFRT
jgi:probable phosphoglycerate mutase